MFVRRLKFPLWALPWLAGVAALPAGAATMTPVETLTCHAFAAEVAEFDAAHPGVPHADMPRYKAIVALMAARVPGSGEREIAAALDDTLIDCAASPDALLLDRLKQHRIAGDRWRD